MLGFCPLNKKRKPFTSQLIYQPTFVLSIDWDQPSPSCQRKKRIITYRATPRYVTLGHITSRHIRTHHVTSRHITSHHFPHPSHPLPTPHPAPNAPIPTLQPFPLPNTTVPRPRPKDKPIVVRRMVDSRLRSKGVEGWEGGGEGGEELEGGGREEGGVDDILVSSSPFFTSLFVYSLDQSDRRIFNQSYTLRYFFAEGVGQVPCLTQGIYLSDEAVCVWVVGWVTF